MWIKPRRRHEDHGQRVAELQSRQDVQRKLAENQLRGLQPRRGTRDIQQRRRLHCVIWHTGGEVRRIAFLRLWCITSVRVSVISDGHALALVLSPIRPKRTLYSKKYGADIIRYTHGDTQTVIYSSNKLDGVLCSSEHHLFVSFGSAVKSQMNSRWFLLQIPFAICHSLTTSTSGISQVTLQGEYVWPPRTEVWLVLHLTHVCHWPFRTVSAPGC